MARRATPLGFGGGSSHTASVMEERQRLARAAERRIQHFLATHDVRFVGAGEKGVKDIAQSWSVEHWDADQKRANQDTLLGIMRILKDFPQISVAVHGETGTAISAPKPLALYLGLREVEDVAECMNFLAKKRAESCLAALEKMGVKKGQLFTTWDGMGGHVRVDFVPQGRIEVEGMDVGEAPPLPPEPYLSREFRRTTIRAEGPRHLPPRQSLGLRNRVIPWAERDLKNALRKFPRLDSSQALREWLIAVSRRPDGSSDFDIFVRVFCEAPPPRTRTAGAKPYGGEAPTTLADLLHFDCARLARLGVCTPPKAKALAAELETLRRVVTADERRSGDELAMRGLLMPDWLFRIIGAHDATGGAPARAPPLTWPEHQYIDPNALREARSRIRALLEHPIAFNGAGEDDLPSIEQAWNVEHTDGAMRFQNIETIMGIADVLLDFPTLRCEVHGETGLVTSAPEALAKHLGLDPLRDVKPCMDALARRRADACREALELCGVPRSQLTVTSKGQGGKIQVDFIPEGDALASLRFGYVPLRFVRASSLNLDGWRTLHLAINCHLDPLPDPHCAHAAPCKHRSPNECDQPSTLTVRSFGGKAADYALSSPAMPSSSEMLAQNTAFEARERWAGSGPRGAYEEGIRSAFFSSTRTPNPHVGDPRLNVLSWKTALLWGGAYEHRESGLLLWCDACCLDQAAISEGRVGAMRYAEAVLGALEECEMLWVYATSDYSTSIYTVLELMAWHAMKTIHPHNTHLLNGMAVTSVAGRGARLPLFDPGRDHSAWLRAQYRKHGSIGREYAATFLKKADIDVRDEAAVRDAFAALAAVAATPKHATRADQTVPRDGVPPPPQPPPPIDWLECAGETVALPAPLTSVGVGDSLPSFYTNEGCGACVPPAASDWERGWVGPPRRHEMHPQTPGRPPASLWHPGPHVEQFLKPGLSSDRLDRSYLDRGRGD